MSAFLNLSGQRFGKLLAINFVKIGGKAGGHHLCRCDCGKEKVVRTADLRSGNTVSCGCKREKEILGKGRKITHGISGTPTYHSWHAMRLRCLDSKNPYYGGRGIKICSFINASVVNLVSTIGKRPIRKTLDRLDSNGHYSCGTCEDCLKNGWPLNIRWATDEDQARNKRTVIKITRNGETKTIPEWSRILGLKRETLWLRANRGETDHRFFLPLHEYHKA